MGESISESSPVEFHLQTQEITLRHLQSRLTPLHTCCEEQDIHEIRAYVFPSLALVYSVTEHNKLT